MCLISTSYPNLAISVPKVEKSAYYISEEQRAEKQEYRRSAARTLLAQGNLEVPGSSLEAQLPSKKRRRLSKRDEAFVSDSDDSRLAALSPSDQAESDLTDYCAAELVGFRSIVTPRDCRAAPTDEPLDFFSSRAFLQDLEPFYYRCEPAWSLWKKAILYHCFVLTAGSVHSLPTHTQDRG